LIFQKPKSLAARPNTSTGRSRSTCPSS